MKGYELYSWLADGEWHFTLITGTNRLKTGAELTMRGDTVEGDWVKITVDSVEELKTALGRLPPGSVVVWLDRVGLASRQSAAAVKLELPPRDLVSIVDTLCTESGIRLELSR